MRRLTNFTKWRSQSFTILHGTPTPFLTSCLHVCIRNISFSIIIPMCHSRDSVSNIVTRLRTERSEVEFRQDKKISLLQNVQTGSGFHPASYPIYTRSLSREQIGRHVKLTTQLHLYPVRRSVVTTCFTLLRVFSMGNCHAATVRIHTSAVLWQSRCNKGKQ
jgi:hypothetical protein